MKQPKHLTKGSLIGITCPSGYVSKERVAYSIEVLERWGFRVTLGKTVGNEHFYFSGKDNERLSDLQSMMDNPEIESIIMARGGYGMSRIIDAINFTAFLQQPKWICGFSDITVLHNHIQANYQIPTLHSPMSGHFKPSTENEDFLLSFYKELTGETVSIYAEPTHFNKQGIAEGILTGGNLALVTHLTGSNSEVDTDGKILFLEDVGEYLYNIDRMMMQLKRAGKFNNLAGLVFGGFTDLKDTERPYGQVVEELLLDKVKEYNFPVCFHFPVGHQDINYTLALGNYYSLTVTETGGVLEKVK